MVVFAKFKGFAENTAEKAPNLGADQIHVALTNTAPSAANAVLADLTQISSAAAAAQIPASQ
jgi:hypothetical protein